MNPSPSLSVIIPSKDRDHRLQATLRSLADQENVEDFEVVVADNGSSDETRGIVEAAARNLALNVVYVFQPRGGPAAARNAAIGIASSELLLLLGDDVEPSSRDLLRRHIELHRQEDDPALAILGRIVWDESTEITDFMQWLDCGGPQFHYHELSAGPVSAQEFFYSSHLSLSKEVLDRAGGFDERFPYAALEDTELGTRLEASGLRLVYHSELVVTHDHPTTLESSLARMDRVGRSAALFNQIGEPGRNESVGDPGRSKQILAALGAAPLTALSRVPLPRNLRHLVWRHAHICRMIQGYRKGPPTTEGGG